MATISKESDIVRLAIRNLYKMAMSSGSLCSILTIVNIYLQINNRTDDDDVLNDTMSDLGELLSEIDKRKQSSQMKQRILEKNRKLPVRS